MGNVLRSNSSIHEPSNEVHIEMESEQSISGNSDIEKALKTLDDSSWTNVEQFLCPWGKQKVTLVHLAAYRGNLEVLKDANATDADLDVKDDHGRCALHYAAKKGHVHVVKWLLERLTNNPVPSGTDQSQPNSNESNKQPPLSRLTKFNQWCKMRRSKFDRPDKAGGIVQYFPCTDGRTPLHAAVYGGHLECIRILIKEGLSLASATKNGVTVANAIFKRIPNPVAFLTEIFDEQVTAMNNSGNKVTLDFRVLTAPPARFPDKKFDIISDLDVVLALIRGVSNMEEREILQHPLLNTFLHMKYLTTIVPNMIFLLFYVFCFCTLFYLSFCTDSTDMQCLIVVIEKTQVMLIGSIIIQSMVIVSVIPLFRRQFFRKELLTCIRFLIVIITVILSAKNMTSYFQQNPSFDNQSSMQKLIVIMILLLSWNMMQILSRFPLLGEYIHMFFAVVLSIGKVLLIFTFLIIGCTLSFKVLFSSSGQLSTPWKALAKTLMMMTGEYDYDTFFPYDGKNSTNDNSTFTGGNDTSLPFTTTLFFLFFVMATSIGLLNLTVGLAVSDIQKLRKKARIQRLMTQADSVLQWVFVFHAIHNAKGKLGWYRDMMANRKIELDLQTSSSIPWRGIPDDLRKALRDLAIKNSNRDKRPPTDSPDSDNKESSLADIQASLKRIEQQIQTSLMQRCAHDPNIRKQRNSI